MSLTSWTPKPAPDFTLKIKEAETEFWAPISKVKEAERTSISKVQPYKKPKGRFRSVISKVQDAESTCLRFNFEGLGRRRTLILKVSGSPEFSWTEFRSSLVSAWTEFSIWFSGSHLDWTGFRRLTASCNPPEKNFEDASWMKFRRKPKDKFWTPISKVPGFHLKNFKGPRLLG
ncbi:unnamed protein product [Rhizophagus irregularis]|nr:unnamed protein product [Rhizophagus irregularis]